MKKEECAIDSILISIKKLLGIGDEYDCFDSDIIVYINSALATLAQLGVGPKEGFYINDISTMWADLLDNDSRMNIVKTYVFLKVKLAFDPPSNSATMEAITRQISELEWRINAVAEETTHD